MIISFISDPISLRFCLIFLWPFYQIKNHFVIPEKYADLLRYDQLDLLASNLLDFHLLDSNLLDFHVLDFHLLDFHVLDFHLLDSIS